MSVNRNLSVMSSVTGFLGFEDDNDFELVKKVRDDIMTMMEKSGLTCCDGPLGFRQAESPLAR